MLQRVEFLMRILYCSSYDSFVHRGSKMSVMFGSDVMRLNHLARINVQMCRKLGRIWYQNNFLSFFFLSKYVSNFQLCIVVMDIWGFKHCPKLLGYPVLIFIKASNTLQDRSFYPNERKILSSSISSVLLTHNPIGCP